MATSCLDTNQSAPLRSNPIASKSYTLGSKTVCFRGFPSLRMLKLSTGDRGVESPMSSAVASHAKTSRPPAQAKESKVREADSGDKWCEWFARFDPASCSWKIRQTLLFADLEESLKTWPRWGLMRRGVCMERPTLMPRTSEKESGYWPTPTATDSIRYKMKRPAHEKNLANNKSKGHGAGPASSSLPAQLAVQVGAFLHPTLGEWLMDFPMEWTALKPLATDRCHSAQPMLGRSFLEWLDINRAALETL